MSTEANEVLHQQSTVAAAKHTHTHAGEPYTHTHTCTEGSCTVTHAAQLVQVLHMTAYTHLPLYYGCLHRGRICC